MVSISLSLPVHLSRAITAVSQTVAFFWLLFTPCGLALKTRLKTARGANQRQGLHPFGPQNPGTPISIHLALPKFLAYPWVPKSIWIILFISTFSALEALVEYASILFNIYLNTEYSNLLEHAIEVISPLIQYNVAMPVTSRPLLRPITIPPGVIVEKTLKNNLGRLAPPDSLT
jgi:hypothetical protein